jgi:hypothetical protein
MEKTIKEAADSLLKKGEITQAEYDSIGIEKKGAMPFINPKVIKAFVKHVMKDPKAFPISEYLDNPTFKEEYAEALLKNKESRILDAIGKKWWLAPATIGAAAVGKEAIIDPIIQEAKINKSFSQLSQHTPQLVEANQDKIRDYFNVIKTYSPHSAANPLVAGALVNKMMEFGGVDHKLIQDIANIQSSRMTNEAIKTMIGSGIGTISKIPKEE